MLPILIPLSTAAVLMLAAEAARSAALDRAVAVAAAARRSAVAVFVRVERHGIQVLQIGGWPAPFGITLVADLLAACWWSPSAWSAWPSPRRRSPGVDPRREAFGYHPLIQVLLMGVVGAFLTGDLFNLYVWFEVMLVASFVLMALHRTSAQIEAAFKYVTLNLIASSIFLTALGLLYGATGTLNMADLARVWPTSQEPGDRTVLAVLFLIAFGIKAGLFPLFFWLPASYHTPPAAVGAAFAGLLTKVGVYALIRVFTLLFHGAPPALFTLLLAMSAATMVVGLVAALNERDFRRVLSFNLVGHIGYTTASLALLTPAALAGAIFYVLHHIARHHQPVSWSAACCCGCAGRRTWRPRRPLPGSTRCWRRWPMIPMFSLAGVPPLSGFLGKLAILQARSAPARYRLGGIVLRREPADAALDGPYLDRSVLAACR